MSKYSRVPEIVKALFVGIDVHLNTWHVTLLHGEQQLFCGSIPPQWGALKLLLERYRGYRIQAVYEAGYFGFWLHDKLEEYGVDCLVTPPNLIPQEVGNRVKTDRRDSRKLASYLSKGMLRRTWVPSVEERAHREVIRRRRQLVRGRVRTQNRIKAALRFWGMGGGEMPGKWSKVFVENLGRVQWSDRFARESFARLLEEYDALTVAIDRQTRLVGELAEMSMYKERVSLLRTVPGIGVIAAMELLLELQDVHRFRKANQLAAYVGLTPSQYSSGNAVRMGHITGTGKSSVRATMVEVAWRLLGKDRWMRARYEELKNRRGAKRAIVAIARRLLLVTRRMLLDGTPYAFRQAE